MSPRSRAVAASTDNVTEVLTNPGLVAESIRIVKARRAEAELRKAVRDAQIALDERDKYRHSESPTLDRVLMSRLLVVFDKVKAELTSRGE